MPRSAPPAARLSALIACLLSVALPGPATGQTPEKFNLRSARRSVVLVKTFTPGFEPAIGSGFLVGKDGLILTCRHVVAPPDESIRGTVVVVGVPSAKDPETLEYYKAEVVAPAGTA